LSFIKNKIYLQALAYKPENIFRSGKVIMSKPPEVFKINVSLVIAHHMSYVTPNARKEDTEILQVAG